MRKKRKTKRQTKERSLMYIYIYNCKIQAIAYFSTLKHTRTYTPHKERI